MQVHVQETTMTSDDNVAVLEQVPVMSVVYMGWSVVMKSGTYFDWK